MKKKLISFGYKESIVNTCEEKNIEIINLIDDFEPKDFLPNTKQNELRIYTKNNANDFFTITNFLKSKVPHVDGVIAPFEFTVFNASVFATFFDCAVLSMPIALNFRDKIVQKETLENVIHTPRFYCNYEGKVFEKNDFPLIVKPVDGTGTSLTYKVNDISELEHSIKEITEYGAEYSGYVIEEFIEGQEFYVDGWVTDGEVQLFMISEYVENLINIYTGSIVQGVNLVYQENQTLYQKVGVFLGKVLKKLNLENGVFHLEFFLNPDQELVFGECAARLGGVMPETAFLHHWKVDLTSVWIDICLGEKPKYQLQEKWIDEHTGFTFIPSPKDLNIRDTQFPDLKTLQKELNFVVNIEYDWYPGDDIPNDRSSTANKIGKVFVTGSSKESVQTNLKKVTNYFRRLYNE